MSLPACSPEQRAVLEALATHNVSVQACPGSGKSTLALWAARQHETTVIVTFNRSLCDDTTRRISSMGQSGTACSTYHALAGRLTGTTVMNDCAMKMALESAALLTEPLPSLLVLDEAQDTRTLYYQLIQRWLREGTGSAPRLLVVGDAQQNLYSFIPINGSDARFLTQAHRLYPGDWTSRTLSQTHRLTGPMCAFTSRVTSTDTMNTARTGPEVEVVLVDVYRGASAEVRRVLRRDGEPERTMILFRSTSHRSEAVRVAQDLQSSGYPVHLVRSGPLRPRLSAGDGDVSKGKTLLCTYFASKGLEADHVIVINSGPLDAGNDMFVALTRGRSRLTIIQHPDYVSQKEVTWLQTVAKVTLRAKLPSRPRKRRTAARTVLDASSMYSFCGHDLEAFLHGMLLITRKEGPDGLVPLSTVISSDGLTYDIGPMLHTALYVSWVVQNQGWGEWCQNLVARLRSVDDDLAARALAIKRRFPLHLPDDMDACLHLALLQDASHGYRDMDRLDVGQVAWQPALFIRYERGQSMLATLVDTAAHWSLPAGTYLPTSAYDRMVQIRVERHHFNVAVTSDQLIVFLPTEPEPCDHLQAALLGHSLSIPNAVIVCTETLAVTTVQIGDGIPGAEFAQLSAEVAVDPMKFVKAHFPDASGSHETLFE